MNKRPRRFVFSFQRIKNVRFTVSRSERKQESRLDEYLNKANVLRQIMSNKSRVYRVINGMQNILTVVISSSLLFIGFSGSQRIAEVTSRVYPVSPSVVETAFNFTLLGLFVIGLLHIVFKFPEKQTRADKSIAQLAALANEIEDSMTTRGNLVIAESSEKLALLRTRYESIAENALSNSDREYRRAKADLLLKSVKKPVFRVTPQMLFDPDQAETIVGSIILGSPAIVDALSAIRSLGDDFYLGGGLIRNAVWDAFHGYDTPTPVDDIDVVYFDKSDRTKAAEAEVDQELRLKVPNAQWSTKNQARMHRHNGERPYNSLHEAISKWPETATAIIVRVDDRGTLHFIAPHGFDDLLRLTIRNTPAFSDRKDIIRRRVNGKRWLDIWPRLTESLE